MKRTRHTAEQTIRKLKTAEQLIAPWQDRRRRLPRDRGDVAGLPPLETAIEGMQAEEARRLTQL